MRKLVLGTTLIELLLYISLLGFLSSLIFSFVLNMHRNAKGVLVRHNNMNVVQVALDILVRDIMSCNSLEVSKDPKTKLICKNDLSTTKWQLDKNILRRIERRTGKVRPGIAKVAEKIRSLVVRVYDKKGPATSAKIKLETLNGSKLERLVVVRRSLIL